MDRGMSSGGVTDILNVTHFLTFTILFTILIQICKNSFTKKSVKRGKDGGIEEIYGLEAIPSPKPTLPFKLIGHMPQLLPFTETLKLALKWSEDHGDVIQISGIGQTFVGMNSAQHAQAFLKSTDFGHLTKSTLVYDLMRPFITNGVLVSKGKFWQTERKTLLKSMSFQSLKAYMTMLNKHSKRFVNDLEELFHDGQEHEINGAINSAFLKVINEMITGFDIHESDEFDEYHHNFQIWKECMVQRLLQPWLLPAPIWMFHPMSRKNKKAVHELFEFARRRIKEHRERRAEAEKEKSSGPEEGDCDVDDPEKPRFRSVLDELMDAGVSDEQMVDEVNTMLFGGHETGASTIHFFLFAIASHPEIQEQCRNEIDEVFEDPSQFKDGMITYEAVSSGLKLVERCILETLRLYPPVFIFFRELKAPFRFELNSQTIELPIGTNVAVCPYTIHRKKEYFPEPEKFIPDRFLPEEASKRHAYSFIPFSSGPRNCLGLKFAMIEMKCVVAYLLRHFIITTSDKIEDIPLLPYITLTPAKDFTFQFKKRDVNMNIM